MMGTKKRFEKEATGNSEMAYWKPLYYHDQIHFDSSCKKRKWGRQ